MQNIMMIIRSSLGAFAIGGFLGWFLGGTIIMGLLFGYAAALVMYRKKNDQEIIFDRRGAVMGFVVGAAVSLVFPMLMGVTVSLTYVLFRGLLWALFFAVIYGNGVQRRGL